jgi:hypothetical protein
MPTSGTPTNVVPRASGPSGSPQPGSTPKASFETKTATANVALAGSPEIVLLRRVGDDVEVLGWRPGQPGLATTQRITGAARGLAESSEPIQTEFSPDGALLLVHAYGSNGRQDTVRVFRLAGDTGREIWKSSVLGSFVAAGFAPTGQLVITSAVPQRRDRGWTIVDLSGKPILHELPLPPITALDRTGTRDPTFYYLPLAFSEDGRWLYAMSAHAIQPLYRPAYRILLATGLAQPIDAFPIAGPARIVSTIVEPTSGRLVLTEPGHAATGRGTVEVWSPRATKPDFQVILGVVFSAVWAGDGSVITADYDRVPGPFRFRVLSISSSGKLEPTLLNADGDNAALVGVRDGFAAAYAASTATGNRELIIVRLADGTTSSIGVSEPEGLIGRVGLRP